MLFNLAVWKTLVIWASTVSVGKGERKTVINRIEGPVSVDSPFKTHGVKGKKRGSCLREM